MKRKKDFAPFISSLAAIVWSYNWIYNIDFVKSN